MSLKLSPRGNGQVHALNLTDLQLRGSPPLSVMSFLIPVRAFVLPNSFHLSLSGIAGTVKSEMVMVRGMVISFLTQEFKPNKRVAAISVSLR